MRSAGFLGSACRLSDGLLGKERVKRRLAAMLAADVAGYNG